MKLKPKKVKLKKKVRKVRITFQKAKRRKVYPHEPKMRLEDLHDEEEYSFFEAHRSGFKLKTIPGYELKYSWKRFNKAFETKPRRAAETWITIRLPDKNILVAQPSSMVQKDA